MKFHLSIQNSHSSFFEQINYSYHYIITEMLLQQKMQKLDRAFPVCVEYMRI